MKIYVVPFEFSRDEYHEPFWIYVDHPEGNVSIGALRYGCEEAKEVVPDLETFGNELSTAFTERDELRAQLEAVREALESNIPYPQTETPKISEPGFGGARECEKHGRVYGYCASCRSEVDARRRDYYRDTLYHRIDSALSILQPDSGKDGG